MWKYIIMVHARVNTCLYTRTCSENACVGSGVWYLHVCVLTCTCTYTLYMYMSSVPILSIYCPLSMHKLGFHANKVHSMWLKVRIHIYTCTCTCMCIHIVAQN